MSRFWRWLKGSRREHPWWDDGFHGVAAESDLEAMTRQAERKAGVPEGTFTVPPRHAPSRIANSQPKEPT